MSLSRKEKIVIFAVILFVCVIVVGSRIYEKKQSEPKAKNRFFENPFSEVDPGIDQQSGNYANDALVVDGYVYFYKSRVKLGNYDKVPEFKHELVMYYEGTDTKTVKDFLKDCYLKLK